MCDLRTTKTAVAIEDDRYFRQTQVFLYLSNVMHCIGQIITITTTIVLISDVLWDVSAG